MTEQRPTSSELRARIIRDQVLTKARHLFELEPRANSVLFLVGQFWSDEADDAVHGELLACVDRDPRWPECARFAANPIGDPKYADVHDSEDGEASTDDAFSAQYDLTRDLWRLGSFDYNGEMIVAFAAYCLEGCDQEQPIDESFTPYCIVRRDVAEPEIVGTMIRPEWEDRWDVIDEAERLALEEASRYATHVSANAAPVSRPELTMAALLAACTLGYVLWHVFGQ